MLRLLPKGVKGLELEELGMADENLALFREMVQKPHGMVLVTGPTGSGKTTTLYAGAAQDRLRGEERHHPGGPGGVRAAARDADPGARRRSG